MHCFFSTTADEELGDTLWTQPTRVAATMGCRSPLASLLFAPSLLLVVVAPWQAAANFRLPGNLDPKRIAGSLKDPAKIIDTVTSHTDKIGKAVETFAGSGAPQKIVDAAVQTVSRGVVDAPVAAAEQVAQNRTAAIPVEVRQEEPRPDAGKQAKNLLSGVAATLQKATEAVKSKDAQHKVADVLKGKGPKEIVGVIAGAAKDTAGLTDAQLKQIAKTVKEETPKVAKVLEEATPSEVEEVEEALRPEKIKAALRAIEDYQWWTLHWRWMLATACSMVLALLAGCWGGRVFWRAMRTSSQNPLLGGMEMGQTGGWSNGKGTYEQPAVEQTHFEQF